MTGAVQELCAGRLRLVAMTAAMMDAERAADGSLAKLIGAKMTREWPPEHWEPHVLDFISKQLTEKPETLGWHRYVVLRGPLGFRRVLVGCVGAFPQGDGDAEMGYSTLPEFQRRGFATAAAGALVNWLLENGSVTSVSAQTFPRLPESIKVMERCGMRFVGNGDEEGTVRYRRRRG